MFDDEVDYRPHAWASGEASMRFVLAAVAFALCMPAAAQETPRTLFTHVKVFDGLHEARIEDANVLVEGNLIAAISTEPIEAEGATIIDGAGRTLMPGLIDAHWHTMLVRPTAEQAIYGDLGFISILAGVEAEATLMRGFTTVRDMGGPAFGLKLAIDSGLIPGRGSIPLARCSPRPAAMAIFASLANCPDPRPTDPVRDDRRQHDR
jgi:hypothetical protein